MEYKNIVEIDFGIQMPNNHEKLKTLKEHYLEKKHSIIFFCYFFKLVHRVAIIFWICQALGPGFVRSPMAVTYPPNALNRKQKNEETTEKNQFRNFKCSAPRGTYLTLKMEIKRYIFVFQFSISIFQAGDLKLENWNWKISIFSFQKWERTWMVTEVLFQVQLSLCKSQIPPSKNWISK